MDNDTKVLLGIFSATCLLVVGLFVASVLAAQRAHEARMECIHMGELAPSICEDL